MALRKSWIIAKKDMLIIRRRKTLIALMLGLPLAFGTGLPLLIDYVIHKKGFIAGAYSPLISAFAFMFLVLAALIPLYLASYGIIGEKLEKTLEPLLSTPTSESEILVGKYIGTLIPSLLSLYLGAIVFMALMDFFTAGYFGYLYFPNWAFSTLLFLAAPIASTYAITLSVFVSSKVNNVMTAYQSGGVTLVPFLVIYVTGEIGLINLSDTSNILIIAGALLVAAIITYFISVKTFDRERILTQWK